MAAWRQKQWKFKNTAPKLPKKDEWITGIAASRLMQTAGNYIQASSKYVAFNVDGHGGGALGVLPLTYRGPIGNNLPLLYAHSGFVSDLMFSPHDDDLLATCSFDNLVKLWRITDPKAQSLPKEPELTLPELPRRGDGLEWNPLVKNLMSVICGNVLRIYDVSTSDKLFEYDCHDDVIQGTSWSLDGSMTLTCSKDKMVRLFDPRQSSAEAVASLTGHTGGKDSRIKWVNDNRFITTGYDTQRSREVKAYDTRQMTSALTTINIDYNNGTLIPLFDPDTDMLFLVGKGDNNVRFLESSSKTPYISLAACDYLSQAKGGCLVPKCCLDVMKGEVNRLIVLTKDSVIHVPYIVPRRSYAEFHADIYTDTYSGEPGCDVTEWLAGQTPKVIKVSLDPAKSGEKSESTPTQAVVVEVKAPNPEPPAPVNGNSAVNGSSSADHSMSNGNSKPVKVSTTTVQMGSSAPVVETTPVKQTAQASTEDSATQTTQSLKKRSQAFQSTDACTQTHKPLVWKHLCSRAPVSVKTSKFRHLKGTPAHRSHRIENIRNLCNTVPGECEGFALNRTRCAVTLNGSAGLVSVFELEKCGRLEDGQIPTLTHGCLVADFKWDPFDDSKLVTGTDSGALYVWKIADDGLTETTEQPDSKILAHNDRLLALQFHPTAKDILVSAAHDGSVKIWDLSTEEAVISLEGHPSPLCNMAWSSDGVHLATFCRDGNIRIYEPRSSASPISTGAGPVGTRGGRILWVLNDTFVAISGFDRRSSRRLQLYDPNDLSVGVASVDLDTAPGLLVPHYDPDSRTIFLTAKGDNFVQAFEVLPDAPYFQVLTSFHSNSQHQAIAFLPKICCDVRAIEFAKAYRLTSSMIEPISFTVPRVKPEYFQDDLFPETRVTWEPTCAAAQWLAGEEESQQLVNLQPQDMEKLSDAPPEEVKERKYEKFDSTKYKSDAQKRDELVSAVTAKLDLKDDPLPQDLYEGVDSDEWGDD